jgi:hypothetical protein
MNNDGSRTRWTFLQGLLLVSSMLAGNALTWVAARVGIMLLTGPTCGRPRVTTARLRVKAASDAAAQYMMDHASECPRDIDELVSQKYLDPSNVKDPWGTKLFFQCPGICDSNCGEVLSAGPDQQEGTPDDIRSWEL